MTTYAIRWWRVAGGRDLQQCMGLTERDLVRRLIGAIETSGPVVIESVTREAAPSSETLASLPERQREMDPAEKQALYGNMREIYRRDPETIVRPAHTAAHDCACEECVKAETVAVCKRAAHLADVPTVPKGHFWRGVPESNRHQCRNCGEHYDKHLHTDEASTCPTANR